jgi:hypothetical protein
LKEKEAMIESKVIYKTVLDTRNFEISLFWQRSNYFLALNSVIALGFFNLRSDSNYSILMAFLGFWASYLWYKVCLGSKFWQSRWEHRLKIIEEKYMAEGELPKGINLFSADTDTIIADVRESLD